jgi:putative phosphoribosyl transferase
MVNMWLGFRDREEGGRALSQALGRYQDRKDVLVLGLPRGGVPVAAVVSDALGALLDVVVVRKVGHPDLRELAMGAVAAGGVRVVNPEFSSVPLEVFDALALREIDEVERRTRVYRGDRPPPEMRGKTVILVDDGIATGATMRAAVLAVRAQRPERIVVATPVASPRTVHDLERVADEVVCVHMPEMFYAIGQWYEDFSQLGDADVQRALRRAWETEAPSIEEGRRR